MIAPRHLAQPPWTVPPARYPASLDPASYSRRLVEVGPGRGDFLFHLAAADSTVLVCGIEIKRKRFVKLMERRERRALANVSLVYGDAREALPQIFGGAPVDAIYVQFPDPWPKRRHARHRLLDAEFLAACAERLRPGGELWFVTDVRVYAEAVAGLARDHGRWTSHFPDAITAECPEAFPTFFAEKWRAEGRTIYYQRYFKCVSA